MADVSYRFAGIPDGVEASVEDVTDPGVEVTTVTGTINGYADATLPIGDYVAIYSHLGYQHQVAGDLASPTDTDYARALPGATELGYAERTTSDTTTNTDYASAASNKISGLSVTVVGEGLPVFVEFYCPVATHSVAGSGVNAVLLVDGAVAGGQLGQTTDSHAISLRRRVVLTAGASYTFEVGKFVGAAGTGTYWAAADYPSHLAVSR